MRRVAITAALAAALLVPLTQAAPVAANPPRMYHVIRSTGAYTAVHATSDCIRTDVLVSSSVSMYAGRSGRVGKQGLTSVQVTLTDTCTASARAAAAGGGGGTPLAVYEGQSSAPLVPDPRLRRASIHADIAGSDDSGAPVTIRVSVVWTASGPPSHDTGHAHILFPGFGVMNATGNSLHRQADAVVTASVLGPSGVLARLVAARDNQASLEQIRWHCIEVPRPGVEGFYPCFGFPSA